VNVVVSGRREDALATVVTAPRFGVTTLFGRVAESRGGAG
jgi:hypothetical protein